MKFIYKLSKIALILIVFIYAKNGFSKGVAFTSNNSVCSGTNIQFNNTTAPETDTTNWQFVWDFGDGSLDSTNYHANHTYVYPGNYFVSLTADSAGIFMGMFSQNITVEGLQGYNPFGGSVYCPNQTVFFDAYTTGGLVVDSMIWDYGDGSPFGKKYAFQNALEHTYSQVGTYHHIGYIYTRCGIDTISDSVSIQMTPPPFVSINASQHIVCPNDVIHFSPGGFGNSYLWKFPNGDTVNTQNTDYTFPANGFYDVILFITDNCGSVGSDTLTIQVKDSVMPNISNINIFPNNACPGTNINFSGYTPGYYHWELGNNTIVNSSDFVYQYDDTSLYEVFVRVTNGCGNSDSAIYFVEIRYDTMAMPAVFIDFDLQGGGFVDTLRVCPGKEVRFRNFSWANGSVLNQQWNFGDGDTSSIFEPSHIFNQVGLNIVSFTLENTCRGRSTSYKYVMVDTSLVPNDFLTTIPQSICPGEQVYFFVDNPSGPLNTYDIWFGDGDSLLNLPASNPNNTPEVTAIHTYDSIGQYSYIFSVTNECNNTSISNGIISVVPMNNNPFYYVDMSADSGQACKTDTIQFFAAGGIEYVWNWNDGSPSDTGQIAYHAFDSTKMYEPTVKITNACGQDTIIPIQVYIGNNLPNAFFFMNQFQYCSGDVVHFNVNNINSTYTYSWDFGDGSFGSGPQTSHVYDTAGFMQIKLISQNGCGINQNFGNVNITKISIDSTHVSISSSACDINTGSITNVNIIDPSFNFNYQYEWKNANDQVISNGQNLFNLGVGAYTLVASTANGCQTRAVTFQVGNVNAPQAPLFSGNTTSCPGENVGPIQIHADSGASVVWYSDAALNDSIYNDTTYSFVLNHPDTLFVTQSINGCESFPVSIIFTNHPTHHTLVQQSICQGDSIYVGGHYQHIAGMYYDTLQNTYGCDSLITTALNINPVYTFTDTVYACDGDSISFFGSTIQQSGLYTHTLATVSGCDSIINWRVILHPNKVDTIQTSICSGETILIGNQIQSQAGYYPVNYASSVGCDSLVITHLTIKPSHLIQRNQGICNGDSMFLQGAYQTQPNTYVDSLINQAGCDSIILTVLTINPTPIIDILAYICDGDSIYLQGEYQYEAGIYYDTLATNFSCDSVLKTTLTLYPNYSKTDTIIACEGDSVSFIGNAIVNSGLYHHNLQTHHGCDSILYLFVHFNPRYNDTIFTSICEGDSVLIGNHYQFVAGDYIETYSSIAGCDSVLITRLAVNARYELSDSVSLCHGDSIYAGGFYQFSAGTYVDSFSTNHGCDSIVTSHVVMADSAWAGVDGSIDLCDSTGLFDLNGLLNSGVSQGYWTNAQQNGALSGSQLSLDSLAPGSYLFWYFAQSNNCNNDSALWGVNILDCDTVVVSGNIQSLSSEWSIFPNPSNGKFMVRSEYKAPYNLSIFDMEGRLIERLLVNNGQAEIDLKDKSSAFYFAKIFNLQGILLDQIKISVTR